MRFVFTHFVAHTIKLSSRKWHVLSVVATLLLVGLRVHAQAPPAAPTNLQPQPTYKAINFSWSVSGSWTGYALKRATASGGPYTAVQTVNYGQSLSFAQGSGSDNNPVPGTTYFYVVTVLNGTAESANSNEVSTVLPLPPAVPANLTVTATGYQQVSLSWSPVSGAGLYEIERANTSGGPYYMMRSAPSSQAYVTDGGLKNGTTYYYTIVAESNYGDSANSNEVNATPLGGTGQAPQPSGLRLAGIYMDKTAGPTLSVAWDPPAGVSGPVTYTWTRGGSPSASGTTTTPTLLDSFAIAFNSTYTYTIAYSQSGATTQLGSISIIPRRRAAMNQAVDSRLDPQSNSNNPTTLNHDFQANIYRGGLYVGNAVDPSRIGRSFLEFMPIGSNTFMPIGSNTGSVFI